MDAFRHEPLLMNSSDRAQDPFSWTLVFLCWLLAMVSMLGSLFFSEVMGYAPCVLCWYQRICMYPLVLILPVALLPFDRNIVRAVIPLTVVGTLVAGFHTLLVGGYIPEDMKPCTQGVPCTEFHINWFGFVTIPLLSAMAFLLITALLILAYRRSSP